MMGFLFGVIVGAFACYVILREGIKINWRKMLIAGIVMLALISIWGLLTFPVTVGELERVGVLEVERVEKTLLPHEIPWPEWMEELREKEGDRN